MNKIIFLLENQNNSSLLNAELLLTAIIAFLSALVVWIIKIGFEKFNNESIALIEIQIALAVNAEKLRVNKSFFNDWMERLQESRLYFVTFHNLIFPYEKLKSIRSSKLLNQTISTFYRCESFGKDLSGIHKTYYDLATSNRFSKNDDKNWLDFNKATYSIVLGNEISFNTIEGNILKDVKDIKKYIDLRSKSFHYKIMDFFTNKTNKKFDNMSKTILIDAVNTFVDKENGIFQEMHKLLEQYPNNKIVLTNADDEQMNKFGLNDLPYEVFTLKHNPNKSDPVYFKTMLKNFRLKDDEVIYFEHNEDAVKSAQSVGITTYHYNSETRDLVNLKNFLDNNL